MGTKGIRDYFSTGRGQIKVRGRAEIVEGRTMTQIVITEIPLLRQPREAPPPHRELVKEKIIEEVSGLRDESDENTRLVVDLKRGATPQVVLNKIHQHTPCSTSFSVNMLAIDNRRPRLLTIKDAIICYIEHRREVILRRTRFLLKKAEDRAETLEAYLLALGNLDEFIRLIRDSKSRDEARERIKAQAFSEEAAQALGIMLRGQPSLKPRPGFYVFTDKQVNAILDLRLYQLTALEQDKIQNDYNTILDEITDLLDILSKEDRVLEIIKIELREIKDKYGTPRRTDFAVDEGDMNLEDLVANEGQIITISHRGYIKRTNAEQFRLQARGGKGMKGMETTEGWAAQEDEDDFVEHLFAAGTHDYLLFFTNTGRVFMERVFSVREDPGPGRQVGQEPAQPPP